MDDAFIDQVISIFFFHLFVLYVAMFIYCKLQVELPIPSFILLCCSSGSLYHLVLWVCVGENYLSVLVSCRDKTDLSFQAFFGQSVFSYLCGFP